MSPIAATVVKRSRDVHCTLCEKTYKNKPSLQFHVRTKHKIVNEVYNVQTKKVEAMLTSSLLMKETENKVVDDSNKDDTEGIEIVQIHTEDEVEVVSPEFEEQTDCDECVSGLVHECVNDVSRVLCEKNILDSDKLTQIENSHVEVSCTICDKPYKNKGSLDGHLKTKVHKDLVEAKKAEALCASTRVVDDILNHVTETTQQKITIDPNDDWFEKTNTDLAEMLETAQTAAAMYHSEECDECGQLIEFDEDINDHMKNMHSTDRIKPLTDMCEVCGELFISIENLREHMKDAHKFNSDLREDKAEKDDCKMCIMYKQAIKKKEESVQNAVTSIKKISSEKRSLIGENKALRKRLENVKGQIETSNCNTASEKIYVCEVCEYEGKTKTDLYNHIHCSVCQTSYTTIPELNYHIQLKHVDEITSVCDRKDCKQYISVTNKQIMETKITLEETVELLQQTMEENSNSKHELNEAKRDNNKGDNNTAEIKQLKLKLDKLEYDLKCKDVLIESLQNQHKEDECQIIDENKSKTNKYKCPKCGKQFNTKQLLQDHMNEKHEVNNKTFPCTKCGATFLVTHALKQHMSAVHNNVDNIQSDTEVNDNMCNACQQICTTKEDLANHMGKFHLNADCRKCLTTFKCWDDIYKHANMCSEVTPIVKCAKCNREVINKTALRSHSMKCHEGENISTCKNGDTCRYLRSNRCSYYHAVSEPVSNQIPKSQSWQSTRSVRGGGQQHSALTRGVKWCRHGDRCDRGRFCAFKHYNLDFPRLNTKWGQ
jgi:hypothetical protein